MKYILYLVLFLSTGSVVGAEVMEIEAPPPRDVESSLESQIKAVHRIVDSSELDEVSPFIYDNETSIQVKLAHASRSDLGLHCPYCLGKTDIRNLFTHLTTGENTEGNHIPCATEGIIGDKGQVYFFIKGTRASYSLQDEGDLTELAPQVEDADEEEESYLDHKDAVFAYWTLLSQD